MNAICIRFASFLAAFLAACAPLRAQDAARTELAALAEAWNGQTRAAFETEYRLYADASSEAPLQTEHCRFSRRDDHYYMNLFDVIEIVQNGRCRVVADHESRALLLGAPRAGGFAEGSAADQFALMDTLLTAPGVSAALERAEAGARLTLDFVRGRYKRCVIEYVPETYRINSLLVDFRARRRLTETAPVGAPRLVVVFTSFEADPDFPADAFDHARFVELNTGAARPAPAYKDYRLLDHLN